MVNVKVWRNNIEQIVSFEALGHAGHGYQGEDIVCSAISILLQTAVMGLEGYLNLSPQIEIKDGFLKCHLKQKMDVLKAEKAAAILETMLIGLQEIKKQYPENINIVMMREV